MGHEGRVGGDGEVAVGFGLGVEEGDGVVREGGEEEGVSNSGRHGFFGGKGRGELRSGEVEKKGGW